MAPAPTDDVGFAALGAPWPPRPLIVPLAPQLRLVAAVAEEEWQRLCLWPQRRQMVLALRRRWPLGPPTRSSIPLRHDCVRSQLSLRRSDRVPF